MLVVGVVAAVVVLTVWGERFRARVRRPMVALHLAEQGLTVLSLRHSYRFFRPELYTYFRVEAIDQAGKRHDGVARASGRLLRRVRFIERSG